jgi:hypothetical protein
MDVIGITALQHRPGLLKKSRLTKIVDKRAHKDVGYFISAEYHDLLQELIETIENEEKRRKLERLKRAQDLEFLETGVNDGLA